MRRTIFLAAALLLLAPMPAAAGGTTPPPANAEWRVLPPMHTARYDAGAEWYFDRIVSIGGFDAHGHALNSVETYDLDYNRWTAAAPMPTARGDFGIDRHGLSLDIDVFGGADSQGRPLSVVEKYNPDSNHWYHLTTMPQARRGLAVAHGLGAGNMMIAGGIGSSGKVLNSALEFIAATHTWRTLPPMPTARYDFALVLASGRTTYSSLIYAIGGFGANHKPLRSVDAYNVSTQRWQTEAPLPAPRGDLAGSSLYPGNVIVVAGGVGPGGKPQRTVDRYNTATDTWSALPSLPSARSGLSLVDTTTSTQPGLFAIGGRVAPGSALPSVTALESPLPPRWTLAAPLPLKLGFTGAITASDSTVYVYSRDGSQNFLARATSTGSWKVLPPFPALPAGETAAPGPNGTVYLVGGCCGSNGSSAVEEYNPTSNSWRARAAMPVGRSNAGAVMGRDGKIYVAAGSRPDPSESDNSLYPRGIEVYDPGTNTWLTRAPMPTARENAGVTLGPNGTIEVIGGMTQHYERRKCFATVEAYNPPTNTWTTRPPLPATTCGLTAVSAPDGTAYAISGAIDVRPAGADAWHIISHVPLSRAGAGAALIAEHSIVIIAGADPDDEATATVQRYSVPNSAR